MTRDLALAALNSLDRGSGFPQEILDHALGSDSVVSDRDRAFAVHLVQGVSRFRLRLDFIINQSLEFSFKKIDPSILNILRIALYQIFFMDRVPQSAAVNEAVNQAKSVGKRHATGFVNGILRKICRNIDTIAFPDPEKDRISYLSVFYSYPEWLVGRWVKEFGIDFAESLLAAENQLPDLVVRANRLRGSREDLMGLLRDSQIEILPTRFSPDGLVLRDLKGSVAKLQPFKDGFFQIQGEAAQICAHLLFPQPGDSVLDLCAGLGGKSTHLAELMGGQGRVFSLDISHGRLVKLAESAMRLNIDCIRPVAADVLQGYSALRGPFDKILLDAPCSGLGVLSKHPDGKWSREEKDIQRLGRMQGRFLDQAAGLLKAGGKMLYVTCTISREENEDVVRAFLGDNSNMHLENLKDHAPEWCGQLISEQGFYKTFPNVHGMEGFFAALFSKGS